MNALVPAASSILGLDGRPMQRAPMSARGFGLGFGSGRAYRGASLSDPDLSTWSGSYNPSPQVAIAADRNALASRVHDLARNDGWASGAVARIVDAVVGANWRLSSRPNARALRIDEDAAAALATSIETQWKLWADNIDFACDAGERLSWGGLLAQGFRHLCWDGEAVAQVVWAKERSWAYRTCVQVIHPDRLSNPNNAPDTFHMRGGVELGDLGQPMAYWVRGAHPGEAYFANSDVWTWTRVARRESWGRAKVVHAFEPQAAGQFRGVSPFAPILKKIRMLGRYDEAELQAALLNAMLAAFVTSPLDAEQLAESMSGGEQLSAYSESRLDWHERKAIDSFERTVLRNIATNMGVSYEQMTMDWSQVNYSSARAALVEVWRGFNARKEFFASMYAEPIYAAWLEEAIDRGDVKLPKGAPSFYEAKTAYCACRWVGPARGWVDPQKEALASLTRMDGGLSTLEDETAEQGKDWQDVLAQQAREHKERERLGLPPLIPQQAAKQLAAIPAEDGDEKPTPGKPEKTDDPSKPKAAS